MKILQEKDSPLLERRSFIFEMEQPRAPTFPRVEIKKRLSEKLKVNENLIHIQKIKTSFGGKFIKIYCNIYNSEEQLKKLETKDKKSSSKPKEKPKEEVKKDAKEKSETA